MSFKTDPVWEGRSHQDRFEVTGERMLEQGLYDAVCYLVSSPALDEPKEPNPLLDWNHFSAALKGRLAYLDGLGIPRG